MPEGRHVRLAVAIEIGQHHLLRLAKAVIDRCGRGKGRVGLRSCLSRSGKGERKGAGKSEQTAWRRELVHGSSILRENRTHGASRNAPPRRGSIYALPVFNQPSRASWDFGRKRRKKLHFPDKLV